MDANFQRVPYINSFTLLMNDTNFTTVSFLESYSCPFAVSRFNLIRAVLSENCQLMGFECLLDYWNSGSDRMPDGFRFGEIVDRPDGVVFRGKPVGFRAEDFHSLDAVRRALLEDGGIGLVRHG